MLRQAARDFQTAALPCLYNMLLTMNKNNPGRSEVSNMYPTSILCEQQSILFTSRVAHYLWLGSWWKKVKPVIADKALFKPKLKMWITTVNVIVRWHTQHGHNKSCSALFNFRFPPGWESLHMSHFYLGSSASFILGVGGARDHVAILACSSVCVFG